MTRDASDRLSSPADDAADDVVEDAADDASDRLSFPQKKLLTTTPLGQKLGTVIFGISLFFMQRRKLLKRLWDRFSSASSTTWTSWELIPSLTSSNEVFTST